MMPEDAQQFPQGSAEWRDHHLARADVGMPHDVSLVGEGKGKPSPSEVPPGQPSPALADETQPSTQKVASTPAKQSTEPDPNLAKPVEPAPAPILEYPKPKNQEKHASPAKPFPKPSGPEPCPPPLPAQPTEGAIYKRLNRVMKATGGWVFSDSGIDSAGLARHG